MTVWRFKEKHERMGIIIKRGEGAKCKRRTMKVVRVKDKEKAELVKGVQVRK